MDGLKATLSFDIDAHDYDDEYIYIDAITREIEIQNPNKVFGTQYDKDSMLIKFKVINAVSDVFKMSDSVIRINWKDSSNKQVLHLLLTIELLEIRMNLIGLCLEKL